MRSTYLLTYLLTDLLTLRHLHAVDRRVEGVGADGAALDVHGGGDARVRWTVDVGGDHVGGDGELHRPDVADGDGVGSAPGWSNGGGGR